MDAADPRRPVIENEATEVGKRRGRGIRRTGSFPTTSIRYDVGDHEDDYVDAPAIPAFDEDPTVLAPEQDEYRITVFELRAGRS